MRKWRVVGAGALGWCCVGFATGILTLAAAAAPCGVSLGESDVQWMERAIATGELADAQDFDWQDCGGGVVQLGVVFHIIRHNDGSDGLYYWEDVVTQSLENANRDLAGAGVKLVQLVNTQFLNDDTYYAVISGYGDTSQFYDLVNNDSGVLGAINVYQVPNLHDTDGTELGGLATYPGDVLGQGIVINNYSTPGNFGDNSTFSHQIGHYLGLYHTSETSFGVECPDESNCGTAGDLICDTAADPGLQDAVDGNCVYVGIEYPADDAACGTTVPYAPPVDNFMSDARVGCRTTFSPDQLKRMSWFARHWRASAIIGTGEVCVGNLSNACESGDMPDATVDQLDLMAVLDHWGAPGGIWDLDQSGVVGIVDLLIVLESWGPC
ncbi:MAG: M43 family zinc metalloprotease [Phycisphaerales bacterium]|nr:M43 family zinc metalloprotease [Phycisphaerales bacterium]